MANKTIALRLSELTGETGLKLRLLDAGTLINPGGDTLTETTNGWFTCTVTEAVTAKFYDVEVVNASDGLEASGGRVYFSGDTADTFIVDDPSVLLSAINGIAGGSGAGARTVTITVRVGSTLLQNARVRLTLGMETYVADHELKRCSGLQP